MCLGTTGNAGAPYADYFRQQNHTSPIGRSQGGSAFLGMLLAKQRGVSPATASSAPIYGASPSYQTRQQATGG